MDKAEFVKTLTAMLAQKKLEKAKAKEKQAYDYIGIRMARDKHVSNYYRSR